MSTIKSSERITAVVEVVAFVALALLSKKLLDPVIWRYAGPISLIGTLIILSGYMRFQGMTWTSMGLKSLPGVRAKLLIIPQTFLTFIFFAAAVAIVMLTGQAIDPNFMAEPPQGAQDRWGNIEGNLPLFLLWLGIVWTAAAFGEEMFFRGFLITRLQSVFAGIKLAPILAVLLPALLFGWAHIYYQGLRGFFMTGAIAIAFGTSFLLFKKNLWPAIIVHGLVDTLGFVAIYMNWDI